MSHGFESRPIRRVLPFFITALALLALASPAHATFPGANGKIAFVRDNDVWTMNPDGSSQVDITNTPTSNEDSPAWSADGTQIAYTRSDSSQMFGIPLSGIWAMGANGTNQHQVVPAPTDTTVCGPGATFYASNFGSPAWSPDGAKIAFHYYRLCWFDTEFYDYDIYTVNPDGTGKTLLKQGGSDPRWSPDGTKVGYTGVCGGGGCTSVRWVTANGSSDFTVYQSNLDNDNFVDWSPDGLLLDGVGERTCTPCFESYTIHPDGTGYTVRPNGVGNWSPDGTKFVQGGVYVQNVDGSGRTQIASSGSSPDWQPIPPAGYPRPRGASPFLTYLVPAYKQCTAPNRSHGSPLAFPSCNPPSRASSFLTVGTPDANEQGAKSRGLVFLAARSAPTDMLIGVSITDVRNAADLSDYTGDLQEIANWRVTDHHNGPSLTDSATMLDIPFPVLVPCAVTADTTVGSTCVVKTSGNAVVPGSVRAGKREVVELGQVHVYDGGSDGDVSTSADNTLFMNQGIFVP